MEGSLIAARLLAAAWGIAAVLVLTAAATAHGATAGHHGTGSASSLAVGQLKADNIRMDY
jgi:hypothetical protein